MLITAEKMLPAYVVKCRSYASGQISIAFLKNWMHLKSQLLQQMPSKTSDKQIYRNCQCVYHTCAPKVVKMADI